jgi:hypothetical protein
MAKYLITTTEVYRVDTEGEVETLITEAKEDGNFNLVKYNREHKERKKNGEIVDEWYKVTLVKGFTDEKDPITTTTITYEVD